MPNLHEISVTLTANARGFEQGINQGIASTKRLEDSIKRLHGVARLTGASVAPGTTAISATTASSKSLISTLGTLTAGYLSLQGAINATKFAVTAASHIETQERAWKAIAGSTKQAATELNFLRTTADKVGVNFDAIEAGYRQVAAASKDTVLEGKATKDIFLAIVEAGAALGLASEDVKGALRAIGQMMSTGTIQADEFKNELGNRLPGIMAVGAKSIGATTHEFMKLMEAGKLLPEEVIPKLSIGIREKFVPALAAGTQEAKTLGQEFARAGNTITTIAANIAKDTGLTDWLKKVARGVGDLGKAAEFQLSLQKMRDTGAKEAVASRIFPLEEMREGLGLGPLSPQQLQQTEQGLAKIDRQLLALQDRLEAMGPSTGKLDDFMDMGARKAVHQGIAALEVERALLLSRTAQMPSGAMRRLPTPGFAEDWGTEGPRDLSAATAQITMLQQYNKEVAALEKSTLDHRRSLQGVAEDWEIVKKSAEFYDKGLQKIQENYPQVTALQGGAPIALQSLIQESAARHGQDPRLITAIMKNESNFNPRAESPRGAKGLMQLMPDKIVNPKDPFNIQQNIEGGVKYVAEMMRTFNGDWMRAVAAYNAGPNGRGVGATYGVKPMPEETQKFQAAVKKDYEALKGGTPLPSAPNTFRTGLEDEFQTGERRHAISLLNLKVDQDRAASLDRLVESLNPVTTLIDEEYRALTLLHAASVGATGDTDAMAISLQNVDDHLKLSSVSLNMYERAIAQQKIEAELALLTDEKVADGLRKKMALYLNETTAIENHTKVLHQEELNQKALVEVSKQLKEGLADLDKQLAQIDAERYDTIQGIIAQMKAGLSPVRDLTTGMTEFEEQYKRLQELGATPVTLTVAQGLKQQSSAELNAIKDGAANFASEIQSRLTASLSGSKDAWKDFGNFAIAELTRIVFQAIKFESNLTALLTKAGSALLKMFDTGAGAGDTTDLGGLGGASGGTGGLDFNQEGGFLGAGQRSMVGEAGRELMLTGERIRLVGVHGPEVVRPRDNAFVIPHQQTMTLLRGRRDIDNVMASMAHRALGGAVNAGQKFVAGEQGVEAVISRGRMHGPEMVRPRDNAFVIPQQQTMPPIRRRRDMVGEAGRELMFTKGGMHLVGVHGPEVVRTRDNAFVIPHQKTMTLLRGRLAGVHSPEVVRGKDNAFVIPHQQTMTLLRGRRDMDNVVTSMAHRALGGSVNAGQEFVGGEEGVEAVISRGGRNQSRQGVEKIEVHVHGVRDLQSFVQPRSRAEIQRAMATMLQAAQRST